METLAFVPVNVAVGVTAVPAKVAFAVTSVALPVNTGAATLPAKS